MTSACVTQLNSSAVLTWENSTVSAQGTLLGSVSVVVVVVVGSSEGECRALEGQMTEMQVLF